MLIKKLLTSRLFIEYDSYKFFNTAVFYKINAYHKKQNHLRNKAFKMILLIRFIFLCECNKRIRCSQFYFILNTHRFLFNPRFEHGDSKNNNTPIEIAPTCPLFIQKGKLEYCSKKISSPASQGSYAAEEFLERAGKGGRAIPIPGIARHNRSFSGMAWTQKRFG